MNQRAKVITGIIAGFAVVFLIIWLSPLGRFILTGGLRLEERPFDSQRWKAVNRQEPDSLRIRWLMLEDLMENRLKTGTDSSVVIEMLGEPERDFGFSYALGRLTEGMDPLYLIVKYDSSGKAEKLNVESEEKLSNSGIKIKVN